MSATSTPPARDTHFHQLYPKVICHVIPQLLDIARNPGPPSHLHSDYTDCAVYSSETCMWIEDKIHVNGVLAPQGKTAVVHHTTLHLFPLTDLYSLVQNRFRTVGVACVCLVVLGLVGLYTWHLTRLTYTPCDSGWQTTMVTEADARKGLFTNLRKPRNVVETPAIADNVVVDASNLALLFLVKKYPPPGYDLMPNS